MAHSTVMWHPIPAPNTSVSSGVGVALVISIGFSGAAQSPLSATYTACAVSSSSFAQSCVAFKHVEVVQHLLVRRAPRRVPVVDDAETFAVLFGDGAFEVRPWFPYRDCPRGRLGVYILQRGEVVVIPGVVGEECEAGIVGQDRGPAWVGGYTSGIVRGLAEGLDPHCIWLRVIMVLTILVTQTVSP